MAIRRAMRLSGGGYSIGGHLPNGGYSTGEVPGGAYFSVITAQRAR
jgi:hypothetical protein